MVEGKWWGMLRKRRKSKGTINPNNFAGLVGKVQKKEGGRKGGEKKCTQHAQRARGSNPGPAEC